ncbi:MAG: 16S rRNA (cytosine(1402)-N(4))-methyltransferase RsmH [Bacteroidota bacterium]|nr:16S rRNA (cytosine(1402)-N(4))-methyltransferase RsmH [Bacteroidota bacterium]
MKTENFHIPVLLNEAVSFLINEEFSNHIIVDGTTGGGSYTNLICEKIKKGSRVISIDKDINALGYAKNNLQGFNDKITFVNGNFGELRKILIEQNIKEISGLVLDLGLSSYQLESEEGFSFMRDTPLDMRAYKKDELTASDILNSYKKDELSEVFENYGEIGNAERLAKAIFEKRKINKFKSTFDLVELINEEYDLNKKNLIDFLAKIFQALRIKVNNELENLEAVLKDSIDLIEKGGRIVIVSYHSLEDRIVKNFFKENSLKFKKTSNPYFDEEVIPRIKILTKKPLIPEYDEIRLNPRSRSAKLRAAEII